jgi:hypothetical protein
MKKNILFVALLFFCINTVFSQKDSISPIYFGITVIPVAPVLHTIEDTTWYVRKYVGGPGGNGGYYNALSKTNHKINCNIASGIMAFISFTHFLDISAGIIRDVLSYHQTLVYIDSINTRKKFNYYRIPLDINFSFFNSKPSRFSVRSGYNFSRKDSRVYEGAFHCGVGYSYNFKNRFSMNSSINFSSKKMNIADNKVTLFPSCLLEVSVSYCIFQTGNHFKNKIIV